MPQKKVHAPDGREWVVQSSGSGFPPPWRSLGVGSEDRVSDVPFLNRLIGDLLIRLFIVPLVIWLVELPIALIRAPFAGKRWLIATNKGPPPVRMRWKVAGGNAAAAVEEVAKQLEAGSANLTVQNAEFVDSG